jgi:hypothetical protein
LVLWRLIIVGVVLVIPSAALGSNDVQTAAARPASSQQEPPPDQDADGLPDASDACPIQPAGEYDTNKNGCPGPWERIRPFITFGAAYMDAKGYEHFASIEVRNLPRDAAVRVRAKGAYIDPKKATVAVLDTVLHAAKNGRARTTKIRLIQFKPGDRFRVNVTHPGRIGYYARFRVYATQKPKATEVACIPVAGPQVPVPCLAVDRGR